MNISEKIKFLRENILDCSIPKFAYLCGVTKKTVYAWEEGISTPCLENIEVIASECFTTTDFLLYDEKEYELCLPNIDDETVSIINKIVKMFSERNIGEEKIEKLYKGEN